MELNNELGMMSDEFEAARLLTFIIPHSSFRI
jgi:hypothetical protein